MFEPSPQIITLDIYSILNSSTAPSSFHHRWPPGARETTRSSPGHCTLPLPTLLRPSRPPSGAGSCQAARMQAPALPSRHGVGPPATPATHPFVAAASGYIVQARGSASEDASRQALQICRLQLRSACAHRDVTACSLSYILKPTDAKTWHLYF